MTMLHEIEDMMFGTARYGRAIPITISNDGASHVLTTEAGLLVGWSVRETTGSARAVADLYSGSTTGGQAIGTIVLSQGAADSPLTPAGGIECYNGLYLNAVAGSMAGAVWYRPLLRNR